MWRIVGSTTSISGGRNLGIRTELEIPEQVVLLYIGIPVYERWEMPKSLLPYATAEARDRYGEEVPMRMELR